MSLLIRFIASRECARSSVLFAVNGFHGALPGCDMCAGRGEQGLKLNYSTTRPPLTSG